MNIATVGPETITEIMDATKERFFASLSRFPDFFEEYSVNPSDKTLVEIKDVHVYVESPHIKLYQGVPEDYDLEIPSDAPEFTIKATTVFGAVRAFETLTQLLDFGWIDTNGDPIFVVRAGFPLFIHDEPAFVFRGLMIDTSRHYLPLNLILNNLDAMAMNKLNVLHWHLTDSQSFPYQTKSNPELSQKGAYKPQLIYTTKDIQTVIYQAYLRGIRVIPEVDMPGHTAAIANSHPEIMSHCSFPSEPLNPTKPGVYDFVETIYKDLDDLFPDEFVHVGGDEVNFDCWDKDVDISKWMKEHNMTDAVQLYEYFETRLLDIVDNTVGKTPIVWQEVFNLNLTITNDTIVDVWKGFDKVTMEQATNQSFRVILSGCWYLDHLNDKWQDYYECYPRDFNGTSDMMELVMGGHASMWGEHVDASNFISRTWPRASAAAERLWTGDVSSGARSNINERIHSFRCRMVQQGFAAGPTGPGFCSHEVPYLHDNGSSKAGQHYASEL